MGRKDEKREIGDLLVRVQQFATMRAYRLLALGLKTLGPVLGGFLPAASTRSVKDMASLLQELDADTLGNAFAQLDLAGSERLLLEILRGTSVETDGPRGKRVLIELTTPEDIDAATEDGGLKVLFEIVKFSLEVNFASFTKSGSGPASRDAAVEKDSE